MIKYNLHTHTVYCDGNNTPEEMIKKAVELGFVSLGFSAHSPMCFENDYAVKEDKFSEYYNEIERLKIKYSDIIEIYNGIELDADSIDLSKYEFDYVIASVHQIHKNGNVYYIDYSAEMLTECVKKEFDGDFYKMAEFYYDSLVKFIINTKPDIVGHIDLIEKFNYNNALFNSDNEKYKNIITKAIDVIAVNCPDVIFEVNTGAMFRQKNDLIYPSEYIMKLLKEKRMNVIVNSDSHSVDSLEFGFDKAFMHCKKAGFDNVMLLINGKFNKESLFD